MHRARIFQHLVMVGILLLSTLVTNTLGLSTDEKNPLPHRIIPCKELPSGLITNPAFLNTSGELHDINGAALSKIDDLKKLIRDSKSPEIGYYLVLTIKDRQNISYATFSDTVQFIRSAVDAKDLLTIFLFERRIMK